MNRPVSVLHVSQPTEAGVSTVALQLITDQLARGWSVGVACPDTGALPGRARELGATVHSWSASRSPGLSVLGEIARLARLIRRVDPDLVHLHSSKAGLAGRLVLRGGRPTLFQPHMWSFLAVRGSVGAAATAWERLAARWTHSLLCVSDDELRSGRKAGVGGTATVVPNGVDVNRLQPGAHGAARRRLSLPDGPTAVCVGRVAEQKGQDLLLTAWPAVLDRVPNARLLLVGDGPMAAEWRRRYPVAQDPSVTWFGPVDDPVDAYLAADVVVVPSRAEGMALVPLEAMACGRPVVAFDVDGIRQSVGDTGAVLPPGDVTGLAVAVADRLADPLLSRQEGQRARLRVQRHFDQGRTTAEVADLVVGLLDAAPGRVGPHRPGPVG